MLEVAQIPALHDNYIYYLRDSETNETAIIDPSEAEPVLAFLNRRNSKLTYILNTHHHWDHTAGNLEIKRATGCRVAGFEGDANRLPGIDRKLKDGEIFHLGKAAARILFIPGHTLGHIAYYFESAKALFCGDTLFSLGCGKLFEGTAAQMFQSLGKMKSLSDDTLVYCAHEYTLANAEWALTVDSNNADLRSRAAQVEKLRRENKPTIPSRLGEEKRCNPFLLADTERRFAELRAQKDVF